MIGAFLSALLIQVPAFHGRDSARYILPFWLVTLLVGVAALIPAGTMPREALIMLSVPFRSDLFGIEPATLVVLAILALGCGIQNNLFLVERNLVFRTTHLTGTTSDLATHLVRLMFRLHTTPEARQLEVRLTVLRALSVLGFLCGAAAGFVAHAKMGRLALTLPFGTSLCLSIFVSVYFSLKNSRTYGHLFGKTRRKSPPASGHSHAPSQTHAHSHSQHHSNTHANTHSQGHPEAHNEGPKT